MVDKVRHLKNHQRLALGVMAEVPSLLLYYGMGTGKTAIALLHVYEELQRNAMFRALVVCPPKLVSKWADEIDRLVEFVDEVTPAGVKALREAVTITSYQKMYRSEANGAGVTRNGKQYTVRTRDLRKEIKHPWDALIIDESQGVGAHNSVQSKMAWKLAKMSRTRYLLSGTPVHGGGGQPDYSKLYGQMRVLMPYDWITWGQFMSRYVLEVDPRFPSKIVKYNEPACRALIENHALVCRLEDCLDLPGHIDYVIKCNLAEPGVYNDIAHLDVEKYGLDIKNGGGRYLRQLQVCSGSLKINDRQTLKLKTSKDEVLYDLLMGTDEKIVIFCNFIGSINRVIETCQRAERTYITIDGRTKDENEWKKFQYGNASTIICQYLSGAEGLDLFASHYTIFYEPHPSSLKYAQARQRTERQGQTCKCINYILTTPGTVEDRSWSAVRAGLDVTERDMEDWSKMTFGA